MNINLIGEEYPVLPSHNYEDGTITLVQIAGDEETIVNAARVSFNQKGYKDTEKNKKLIRRLVTDEHYGVLEHCWFTVMVTCPLFVAMQWVRHRTFSYNMVSRRYTEVDEQDTFFIPTKLRLQSQNNKQGSSGLYLDDENASKFQQRMWLNFERDMDLYNDMLNAGVARELARIVLPTALFTRFYATGNLRNWLHFISLRSDNHAQEEIRVYSDWVKNTIVKAYYPTVYEAILGDKQNGQ